MELNKKNNLKFFLKKPLILVAVVMLISAFFVYKSFISKGATFGWIQSSWSGGATANTAGHENNQSGWTEFAEKDDNVDVSSGEITLSSPSEVLTDTTDEDFKAFTKEKSSYEILNGDLIFKKPPGAGCSENEECAVGICSGELCTVEAGMAGGGGIVASPNFNGKVLIAQTNDAPFSYEWGCHNIIITGADSFTDGKQNTIDIMNGCSTAQISARVCDASTDGGFDDWYLPARDELAALYQNRVLIGGFLQQYYQSSTEYSSVRFYAQLFMDNFAMANLEKRYGYSIRCVRSLNF